MTNDRFSWHCDTQTGSGLAHSSHTCSIPRDASPVARPSPLACSSHTCWDLLGSLGLSENTGCSSRAVLSVCLGTAQRSRCSDSGQSRTLLMVWDKNVFRCRKNRQALLSTFNEHIRTIGSKQKQWPVFPPPKTPSLWAQKHQVDYTNLKQEGDKFLVSTSAPCPNLQF